MDTSIHLMAQHTITKELVNTFLATPCNNDDFTINVVQETLEQGIVEIQRLIIRTSSGDIVLRPGNNGVMVGGRTIGEI